MKKLVIALSILAMASTALAVSPDIRIAQVYGGGGATSGTPTYMKDYVVLFNASGNDVNITGWVLEYGSATGNWGSAAGNYFVFPEGTWVAGCSYLMVSCGALGTVGAEFPVTPDFVTTNMSMSGTNGKMAIFNTLNANVTCGSETPGTLVDKVAYGSANCAEGTAVAVLSTTTGADRNNGGQADTDVNVDDFTVVTAPIPMNSATPALQCAPVTSESKTWGTVKSIWR